MNKVSKLSSKMFVTIPENVRSQMDAFLEKPTDPNCLKNLVNSFIISDVPGNKYNVPCLNAAIFFIGLRGMSKIKERKDVISKLSVSTVSQMKALQTLIGAFCTEGKVIGSNKIFLKKF